MTEEVVVRAVMSMPLLDEEEDEWDEEDFEEEEED